MTDTGVFCVGNLRFHSSKTSSSWSFQTSRELCDTPPLALGTKLAQRPVSRKVNVSPDSVIENHQNRGLTLDQVSSIPGVHLINDLNFNLMAVFKIALQ